MSTFGIAVDELRTGYDEVGRPPRRLAAVAVFAVLTVAGAGGSWLAIVNGLGTLLRDKPPAAQAYPLAAAAPPGTGDAAAGDGGTARTGRGGAPAAPAAPAPDPATPRVTSAAPAVVPVAPLGVARQPRRGTPEHRVRPTPPCGCVAPPVPTPTAPSASPSVSPSASPSPGDSADPSDSPSPSGTAAEGEPAHGRWRKPGR
jgi:hypothetical protein